MKNGILILLSFCLLSAFKSFPGGPGDYAPIIKKQAEMMGAALKKDDFNTYLKYVDPRTIAQMGGTDAFIDTLKNYAAQRKHHGETLSRIDVDDPSWVIDTAGELQSTVSVSTQIDVKGGYITTTSTFIALSKDKGKNWVFLNSVNGYKDLRQKFSDISSRLVVPASTRPTFTSF